MWLRSDSNRRGIAIRSPRWRPHMREPARPYQRRAPSSPKPDATHVNPRAPMTSTRELRSGQGVAQEECDPDARSRCHEPRLRLGNPAKRARWKIPRSKLARPVRPVPSTATPALPRQTSMPQQRSRGRTHRSRRGQTERHGVFGVWRWSGCPRAPAATCSTSLCIRGPMERRTCYWILWR